MQQKKHKSALPRKNCKRPGLKQPGLGTPNFWWLRGFSLFFFLEGHGQKARPWTNTIYRSQNDYTNIFIIWELPPGTKPIHAGKTSWGINFCANTCGVCIGTRANTGKYFWGIIFRILAKFLREFIRVRIHVAPVFAPVRIQENIPGELFMYWFRARG